MRSFLKRLFGMHTGGIAPSGEPTINEVELAAELSNVERDTPLPHSNFGDTPRPLTAEEITEYWGPRCPEYDNHCPTCQMWAMYDALQDGSRAYVPKKLPFFWQGSKALKEAVENYNAVKADFDAFDGDRRGISYALGEAENKVINTFGDLVADDEDGHHYDVSHPIALAIVQAVNDGIAPKFLKMEKKP